MPHRGRRALVPAIRALILALCFACPAAVLAQGGVAQATIAGVPPVLSSPFIGDLERDYRTGRFTMVFNYTGQRPAAFRFEVSLEREGKVLARGTSMPVTYQPGTYVYTTFDASPAIRFPEGSSNLYKQLEASLGNAVVRSNLLPEGQYTLRVEPIPDDLALGIAAVPGVAPFLVRFPEPAVPVAPAESEAVSTAYPLFNWLPAQLPPGSIPEYELLVVEIQPSQTPLQALRSNRAQVREVLGTPVFAYSPEQLPLQPGKSYAWQLVTRATLSGYPLPVRDDGKSEIRTFRYEPPAAPVAESTPASAPSSAGACAVAAPANNTPSSLDAAALRGQTVRLGRFDLAIDDASGSASNLSGRGTIHAALLGAPLRVEFSGLAVNAEMQAYAGRATATTDRGGLLPDDLLTGFTGDPGTLASAGLAGILSAAREPGRLVKGGAGAAALGLPLGVEAPFGAAPAVLAIVGAEFLPTGARANAVLDVPVPEFGKNLYLGARGLCLSGESVAEGAALQLLRDVEADVGGGARFTFRAAAAGDSGTYAVWGKSKLDRLRVALDAAYPREWLVPVDASGNRKDGNAIVRFRFDAADGNWLAQGRLDPVEIAAAPGFIIQANSVYLDNSTSANPAGMQFPAGYAGLTDGSWTGLYIPQATLQLPAALRTFKDPGKRLQATLNHFIVDDGGVSVLAQLSNVIAVGAGDLGGWGYDIAALTLDVRRSSLVSGTMSGGVRLPLGSAPIPYTATMSKSGDALDFSFGIKPPTSYKADLWAAQLALSNASSITVKGGTGTWSAAASLHGALTLGGSFKLDGNSNSIPLDFKGIKFEGLGLSTSAPYVSGGTWSFASPQHAMGGSTSATAASAAGISAGVKGFPVTIRNLQVKQQASDIGLTFNVDVNLPGAESFFNASTGLGVWGRVTKPASQPVSASFRGVSLEQVKVAGELSGVFRLDGLLEFYHNDNAFGNGIYGKISATALETVKGSAEVRFGDKNGVEYWFADLMVQSDNLGVPLAPGLGLFGFGGGASYHMNRTLPTADQMRSGTWKPTYVVDRNAGLGIRAKTTLATHPTPHPFNADVTLEVILRSAGGVQRIGMDGDAWLVTGGVVNRGTSLVKGTLSTSYDFANGIFNTDVGANINWANLIWGTGTLRIHANQAQNKYYLRIGDTQQKGNVGLNVGIKGLGSIGTWSYFHMGTDVPAVAPPPAGATGVVSGNALALAQGGTGFLYGARAEAGFDASFLVFYAALHAGLGYDFAFVRPVTCAETGGLAGINGWYASGQAFAYLSADVGIQVSTFFYKGRVHAFKASGAAGLEGGAPNPVWVKGNVSGRYSVLGGAVKGSVTIPFSVGTVCTPIIDPGNPLELQMAEIISDLGPTGTGVSVFSEPAAAFTIDLDTPFDLIDNAGEQRWYRVVTDGITLRKGGATGPIVHVRGKREQGGGIYKITPDSALEGLTTYHISVTVRGQERKNGVWVPATVDGRELVATRATTFKTAARPRTILDETVSYTYPLNQQRYFLYRETTAGGIRMAGTNINYNYLHACEVAGCKGVEIKARFIAVTSGGTAGADTIETAASISGGQVAIPLPGVRLRPEQIYVVQLVRKETSNNPLVDLAAMMLVKTQYTDQILNLAKSTSLSAAQQSSMVSALQSSGSTITIRSLTVTSHSQVLPGERLLYKFMFRTSRFGYLSEKLATASIVGSAALVPGRNYVYRAQLRAPAEPFEDIDLKGTKQFAPLVHVSSPFTSTTPSWSAKYVTPAIERYLQLIHSRGIMGSTPYSSLLAERLGRGQGGVDARFVVEPPKPPGGLPYTLTVGSYCLGIASYCWAEPPASRDVWLDWDWGSTGYADHFLMRFWGGVAMSRQAERPFFLPPLLTPSEMAQLSAAMQGKFTPPSDGIYDLVFRYRGWTGADLSRQATLQFRIGALPITTLVPNAIIATPAALVGTSSAASFLKF